MAYPNALFSTCSFIGFLFCAIPLYWHLEAWNVGTSLYIVWAGLACLNTFINSVVWNNSIANVAPVWCDISSRLIVGVAVGIPAALLVISRRLYKIATRTAAFPTTAEKRRNMYVDLAIGLGIPILQMVLEIIVEGHRFDIFEEVGCFPNIYNVPPVYPLVFVWPPAISTVTFVYSCLNIRLFWKCSRQLKEMVGSYSSASQSRYIRLIALSSAQVFITLPITVCVLYLDIHNVPMSPWISWEDTHSNYSFVGQVPSFIWRASPASELALELNRWLVVFSAFVFFAFFGFAEEALKHYRLAYTFASSRLRIPELATSRASGSSSQNSPSPASSFGPGFMKHIVTFKDGFSVLGSHGQHETMTERANAPSSFVPEHRLTSGSSIFMGANDGPKAIGLLPDEDDVGLAHVSQNVVVTLPVVPRVPLPPSSPSIASIGGYPIPSGRLDSPLPHRPMSAYPDIPEDV